MQDPFYMPPTPDEEPPHIHPEPEHNPKKDVNFLLFVIFLIGILGIIWFGFFR